jgi:hypothetical protein
MSMNADDPVTIHGSVRDDLWRHKVRLEQRLEDGSLRIDQAEAQGRDVTAWEAFWLELLKEYEAVCDELLEAA